MAENAFNLQPFGLDAVSIVTLFQVVRIFFPRGLSFVTCLAKRRSILEGRGLILVELLAESLPRDSLEDFQLRHKEKQ